MATPPDLPERIARLRQERRRQLLRRRRIAAGTAVAGVVLAVTVFVVTGSDGGSGSSQGNKATAILGGRQGSSDDQKPESVSLVRNATPQDGWAPYTGPVPMLMYHVLGEVPPGAALPGLFVAGSEFRDQMKWLDDNGFQAVTMAQVMKAWEDGGTLPKKPVVLSFDDGYDTQYTDAYPVMKQHGWAGVLNLKAGETDIYTSQVREMIKAGWELASHTITHPDLTTLDAATLKKEVAGSRSILEKKYGVTVDHFCYPSGAYNDAVIAAVEDAGYGSASTVDEGLASQDELFRLKRIRVDRGDGAQGLAASMAAAGD